MATRVDVYVERGVKRTFASAVDWPGWARSGRDEAAALAALLASAPRYAKIVSRSRLGFPAASSELSLRVIERLPGTATTDFGAPAAVPRIDATAVTAAELRRIETLIAAAWRAFDDVATRAKGIALAKGPRGGGRSLDAIVAHVREAEAGYLSALGWPFKPDPAGDASEQRRRAVIDGLRASVRGEIAERGPRGGTRSKPRQFARRLAWRAIDHAWEIEDRAGR
ncbi:MAG TPA: hypothetical protein VGQ86_05160 [Candidatus Limnocylindria bacterium]|nr:hypothetical protein [Candidatus Limnocylindria bacterium]